MSAPLLRALDLTHPNLAATDQYVPLLPVEEGLRAFLVVGEGTYAGSDFAVGDVLVCRGTPRSGQVTVLEARHGRPRLGTVVGRRLLGDAGEACHPGRWRPVGALWARFRPAMGGGGWTRALLAEAPEEERAPSLPEATGSGCVGRTVLRSRRSRPVAGQLGLFAA